MNYTQFLDSLTESEYQVEKKQPKCKKGYKWDEKIGGCVPIGAPNKNKEENKDSSPANIEGFNVWGSNGRDGGYALEEPQTQKESIVYSKTQAYQGSKEQKKDQEDAAAYAARKKKMTPQKPEGLRPGQFKAFNKQTGKWEVKGRQYHEEVKSGEFLWFDKKMKEWVSSFEREPTKLFS